MMPVTVRGELSNQGRVRGAAGRWRSAPLSNQAGGVVLRGATGLVRIVGTRPRLFVSDHAAAPSSPGAARLLPASSALISRARAFRAANESLNYQLRKVTKARGHFPNDDAVVKLLWLAIINIEDKRARERQARRAQTGKRSDQPARLVEGQRVMGWREALNELDSAYPGRLR